MGNRLANGAQLPAIPAKDTDGNDVDLTTRLAGGWGVVLFFRGHW